MVQETSAIYDVFSEIDWIENFIIEVNAGSHGTDEVMIRVGCQEKYFVSEKKIKDNLGAKIRVAPEFEFLNPDEIYQIQFLENTRKLLTLSTIEKLKIFIMKKSFFISLTMLSMSLIINAQTADDIKSAKDLTFFGVDYSNCYFVPSEAFYDLDDVKEKINAWNNLFKSEFDKYLAKNFKNRKITFSDEMISSVNEQIDPATRVSDDEALYKHLNPEQIPSIVDSYKFSSEDTGVGFILIAECYSKPEEKGSYYVVFFDIPTKKVLTVDRMTGKARGFGLRNYWANSYFVVLKDVGSKIK